ncbi:long-chain-fatty-acid--CoA ligase [Litorimonas haliclonae]|uniref:long-chain-fatty-acid--CoA ligase n=1 Tax=Litorimonas haliclonae TaxID=2081977 RepID=UPI0039EED482
MRTVESAVTLGDLARIQAQINPEKTLYIYEDHPLSFEAFNAHTNQLANGLLALDLKPDERVCYLGKNTVAYYELLIGTSKAGGVTCPINWRLSEAEIAYILSNSETRILFVGPEYIEKANRIAKAHSDLTIIALDSYDEWRDQYPSKEVNTDRLDQDDVLQLYTSGTTGRPKGVRMSNAAMLSNRRRDLDPESPAWNRWTSNDVGLVSMPCFHIGGTSFGLTILYAGATGVIMPTFDAGAQLDIMVKYDISKQFIVPSALQIILDDPRVNDTDFSKLNYIQYGASPIPLELMKACIDVFGCEFVQKYGMTETCGTCVALSPEDHTIPENPKMKSVGKPLNGVELRITDPEGQDCAVGETGEIVIRSASNMSGYWKNEEATKQTFFEGGWLRSGDAGFLDDEGYLYIQDRIKDMIVSGGENIYSAEVEIALLEDPLVQQVAVIGVPDEKWGEAVMAYIVLKDNASTTSEQIIENCRSKIAKFKCPKRVEFLTALPRNASGKILKRELRATHWGEMNRGVN